MQKIIISLLLFSWTMLVYADIVVTDDAGKHLTLQNPARRIISLAPHVTELLFAVGAGQQISGVVSYSNFPEEARRIPQIGGYKKLDIERIVSMQPDLIIGWQTGNAQQDLQRLQQLGFKVFLSEPRHLPDIASMLLRLGKLSGHETEAQQAASQFMQRYQQLKQQNQDKKVLRAFYQIWDQPLMTINDKHLISDVMRLCGLQNVFADVDNLVPRINVEAVLKADPQLIIAGGMAQHRPDWTSQWLKWPGLSASQLEGIFDIDPDLIQRHSPRILQGATQLCQYADEIRNRLEK